jgi:DNA-binding transcriptional LysR family regulator
MGGKYDIPLEWYGAFCAVAKAVNVTAAAVALHVSQPAVSMALRQLEERLGHTLFMRAPRGMRLTPEGEALYACVEKAMGFIDAGERRLEEMARLERGRLSIAASDTLCSRYLLPVLEEYNRRYPGITISVMNKTSPETLDIIRGGGVDIGFVSLPAETDGSVEVMECLAIHDCLVCGEEPGDGPGQRNQYSDKDEAGDKADAPGFAQIRLG